MSFSYTHHYFKHNYDIAYEEMRKWRELREDWTLEYKIEG